MHIDMDSFFVSVTLRDKPHLRGKPIAVCHAGKGDSTNDQGTALERNVIYFMSSSKSTESSQCFVFKLAPLEVFPSGMNVC